jgi:hypothetical protein
MLLRGDLQKLNDQINPVFETAFSRIDELTKRVEALEEAAKPAPKPAANKGGRPKKDPESF